MTDLHILNREAGEVVAVVTATDLLDVSGVTLDSPSGELAAFYDHARNVRSLVVEAQGIVGAELIERMDRDGCWTMREDGFEVRAPSPAAGTVSYDTNLLDDALGELVMSETITPRAARSALEVVWPTVPMPYSLLRRTLALLEEFWSGEADQAVFEDLMHQLGELLLGEPEPTYKLHQAGIKALLKLPDARKAIEACEIPTAAPPRTVRVKRALA